MATNTYFLFTMLFANMNLFHHFSESLRSFCKTNVLYFKDFIYLFLEREWEGGREEGKHQYVVASHAPLSGDLACNPGMCHSLGIIPMTL